MRETTESIAKRRVCGVSTESVDMLFAPRKLRVRGNGKYFIDHWAGGVTRIVVASTGRIVAVFEDFRDAHRTKNLLNNDSSERKSKAEMERLREQIKCGHSMELDSLARERDELLVENERLLAANRDCIDHFNAAMEDLAAAQAKIDSLMLEYCQDEMTPEQIDNWGKHQKAASDQTNLPLQLSP